MPSNQEGPVHIEVVNKPRKSSANTTSFKPGNAHRFKPGDPRISPGGKVKVGNDLLSKALRVALADRAPDDVCNIVRLPHHSSWAQVIAQRLVYLAVGGDIQAIREIREATEGTHSRLDVSSFHDLPDPDAVPPLLEIAFIESDGAGHPAPGSPIDAEQAALPAAVD